MGLVGPPQLAGWTKGQLAIVANQGAVRFGEGDPPPAVRDPDPRPNATATAPSRRRPPPATRRRKP